MNEEEGPDDHIGEVKKEVEFLIFPQLQEEIIMGQSWLQDLAALVDIPRECIYFAKPSTSARLSDVTHNQNQAPILKNLTFQSKSLHIDTPSNRKS